MDAPPNHYGICSTGNTRAVPRINADSGRILSALDSKDGFKKMGRASIPRDRALSIFSRRGIPTVFYL